MESTAPKKLACDWDNVGLLLGNPAQKISRVFVCLDVTQELADETQTGDLIISHHPMIFKAMKKIDTSEPTGKLISTLIKKDISVFAAHTNLDCAIDGVNDILAKKINLENLTPFDFPKNETFLKLIIYVPKNYAQRLQDELFRSGAGKISSSNYTECSFSVAGVGTFRPNDKANPFLGEANQREHVEEIRLEMIFAQSLQEKILQTIKKFHPYEEPAFDLFELKNNFHVKSFFEKTSLGRIGTLAQPMTFENFAAQVKNNLRASSIRLIHANDKPIKKVGVCSGSGADLIDRAKFLGCDAFVTGDVRYHDAQRAKAIHLNLIDAGHFATEFPIVEHLSESLKNFFLAKKISVDVIAYENQTDFFQTI